ncbi:SpoIIE family protein phosphatase [Leptospira sp. 96542]|nr:SpoIIE family protein phosphatase [Leptospira sp. 96542]
MNQKKLFWDLTLKLETFTHTVPVPFAVYYAIITQKMQADHWRIFIALCVVFAVGIGLLGTFVRHLLTKYLFAKIDKISEPIPGGFQTEAEIEYAKSVKLFIFRYPLIESIIIVVRWFAGVVPIITLYTYLVTYTPSVVRSGVFTILMIAPISFIAYYFIAENTLRNIFDHPKIKNIKVNAKEVPKFDYFARILLAFFSLATLPLSVLSYLLYSVAKGETAVEDPLIPIVIVSSIFIVPLIVCSYIVAKTVKEGLNETSRSLSELGNGNFNVVAMPKSSDDFAQQTFFLNNVIHKLKTMYEEIKNLNEGLEEKVNQRTEELNQTLLEVQSLKSQQDGDYFLTYQLLNPLANQEISCDHLTLNQIIKQKKNFEFKNRNYEIGGDINISHTIHLRNKKYLLFVNADAMGKSMQGASGALVFGAIFQSIAQRTKNNPQFQNISPEDWLSEYVVEMHRIFETFDGTMLVSMVMGLIEDMTGVLYFLNAEHPNPVLYRDKKANYVNVDKSYRKLGTLGATHENYVQTLQLLPNDILLIGSDGKDDILLESKPGNFEVNLDDQFFLDLVETTDAKLENIISLIEKKGQIIDDISLIRIDYLQVSQSEKNKLIGMEILPN